LRCDFGDRSTLSPAARAAEIDGLLVRPAASGCEFNRSGSCLRFGLLATYVPAPKQLPGWSSRSTGSARSSSAEALDA